MPALESALPWVIVPEDRLKSPARDRRLDMERYAEIFEINKGEQLTAKVRKKKDEREYFVSLRVIERNQRIFLAYKCTCPSFRRRTLAAAKKDGVLTKIGQVEGYFLSIPPKDLELDKHVWFAIKNGLIDVTLNLM